MNRKPRIVAALSLSVALSGLLGVGVAGAQEMEHGRTRPASREVQSNQVKTQDAIMNSYAGYVRA